MEENKKQSFLMYYEYEENLEVLTDEQLGKLLRAIFKYEKLGFEPKNLGSLELMAFNFIKGNLNRDKEKYDKRAETSAINGKKGGRPRKEKPNQKPNEKPKKPKKADNDNDNDIVNDNDNDNGNGNVYDFIENEFGRTLSPTEYEVVLKWEDNELTRYAIKQAVLNGAYSIKYILRILENYEKDNIKTVQQAIVREEKFKNKGENPEWYEKEIEHESATVEEINDLEKRLKNFK